MAHPVNGSKVKGGGTGEGVTSMETDASLNFYCRLPMDRTLAPNREASPAPMGWLKQVLDTFDQPIEDPEAFGLPSEPIVADQQQQYDAQRGDPSGSRLYHNGAEGSDASYASGSINGRIQPPSGQDETPTLTGATSQEEEAPWFSQLVNLPQVRSAGVPAPTPVKVPVRRKKEAPLSNTVTATAAAAAAIRRTMTSDGSSGRISSDGSTVYGNVDLPQSSASSLHTPDSPIASENEAAFASNHPSRSSTLFSAIAGSSTASLPLPPASGLLATATASTSTSAAAQATGPLIPPDNFAMVNTWVYRSSFPKKRHFPFLQTLGLKSVLTLILEEYPEQNMHFLDQNGITFFQFGIPGNKEPFVQIPQDKITAALVTIMDRRNHPMLIHCNKGKHRTGCLIGCLRKLQQWSLTTIFDEYRRFSFPKSRSMDQEFIELYRESMVWHRVDRRRIPRWAILGKNVYMAEEVEEAKAEQGHHRPPRIASSQPSPEAPLSRTMTALSLHTGHPSLGQNTVLPIRTRLVGM